MGRGKLEIKRIENSTNRQVTFAKRRNGIMKKAREISVLCDAAVSVVIFSSSGKLFEFCSPNTTLPEILERYQNGSKVKLWDDKHETMKAEIDRIKKENDKIQTKLRHMNGEDLSSLQPKDLIPIEEALQNGHEKVHAKQMEIWRNLKNKENVLEEQNKELNYILHQKHLETDRNIGELELGYHQRNTEFAPQMAMPFLAQPIQPNLQLGK